MQLYAIVGMVVVAIAACAVVAAALFTNHDLSDPRVVQVLGFAVTIFAVLAGIAGVTAKVQDVHTSINGRMDQLVATTASNSFQQGQAAGPSAAPPPATPEPPQNVGGVK
jgi:hypothetical protein